jgi:glutamate/tyrosine decarboxylase-like PLP-dependent enzyme
MTIKAFGANRLGDVAERSCLLARRFAAAIDNEPLLERTAPVRLNIVCFRYRPGDDELQTAIAADLQEAGDVVLSTTTIGGRTVLRAAFVNHRSDEGDADAVIPAVLGAGLRRLGAAAVAADQASHTPD